MCFNQRMETEGSEKVSFNIWIIYGIFYVVTLQGENSETIAVLQAPTLVRHIIKCSRILWCMMFQRESQWSEAACKCQSSMPKNLTPLRFHYFNASVMCTVDNSSRAFFTILHRFRDGSKMRIECLWIRISSCRTVIFSLSRLPSFPINREFVISRGKKGDTVFIFGFIWHRKFMADGEKISKWNLFIFPREEFLFFWHPTCDTASEIAPG